MRPPSRAASRLAAVAAAGPVRPDWGDPDLDRLTRLACLATGAATAAASLVDDESQAFVSSHGLPPGLPRRIGIDGSLCARIAETGRPLRVSDAGSDPAVAGHPAVGTFGIGSYLGWPILGERGVTVGAFCLFGPGPREWTAAEEACVAEFAAAAGAALERRRERGERAAAEAALRENQALLDAALESSGLVGTWFWEVGARRIVLDRHLARLFGFDPDRAARGLTVAAFASAIHPEDRARVTARNARLGLGDVYDEEHRVLRPDGSVIHVESRGRCVVGADGRTRFVGIVADVTRLKGAAERQAGIATELGHRIKNLMATIQAIVFQTLRECDGPQAAAAAVSERLVALSRSHEILLSRGDEPSPLTAIVELVTGHFGPGRFTASGPAVDLPPRAALGLSLALHELATNAVKYGSLSVPGGTVGLTWRVEGDPGAERLGFLWVESGGPAVSPPSRRGLGSRLLERLVAGELAGRVGAEYGHSGLVCRIEGDLAQVRREYAAARARPGRG